ncbi:hypothetical protein PINS_up002356 [Pythium insidiosum]|nr:hypothetical protein PINS_up002356 [Pythium insidiosum]
MEPPSERCLFDIRRVFSLDDAPGDDSRITAMAVHASDRSQLLALAVSSTASPSASTPPPSTDATSYSNALLVRSVDADRRVRLWRFPLATSRAKQAQQVVEPVAALAFSPEGDWLACLSTRRGRLHVVPVARLIATHRRAQLRELLRAHSPHPQREWMDVAPSAMTTQMASYLRATNEGGGRNGARYGSRVAGDDEQMSTLEFAAGMGPALTCVRWWRAMNGKNYCLVGGAEHLISIVDVAQNAEECRCELQNAGRIEAIELFYEAFRKEKRTSMLVQTRLDDVVKYFRVVLEKKSLEDDAVKTFPDHFVQDADFRPQRIKKNSPGVRLCAINGPHRSESSLAMVDVTAHTVSVFSNLQWSLKSHYRLPAFDGALEPLSVRVPYCSSDLLLLQAETAQSQRPVSAWVSLPSRVRGPGIDDKSMRDAHVVHHLSLHSDEPVERVVQTTAHDAVSASDDSGGDAQLVYLLQTRHCVYECRPQWSRLALFRALRARSIALRDALSIGYALGIDMPSLCEVVADTVVEDALTMTKQRDVTGAPSAWVRELFDVSRAPPSKIVAQLTAIGGSIHAIDVGQRALQAQVTADVDDDERRQVALQVVELIFQHQVQNRFTLDHDVTLRPRDDDVQARLEAHERWLSAFLKNPSSVFDASAMLELCLKHHQLEKATAVAVRQAQVSLLLTRLRDLGIALPSLVRRIAETLVADGHATALLEPTHRSLLRSLPTEAQAKVLLAAGPIAVLRQRDWVLRHLDCIPLESCIKIVKLLHPDATVETLDQRSRSPEMSDVDTSETTPAPPEERVELFLSLLLRINSAAGDANLTSEVSQRQLEKHIQSLAGRYRPPIIIARCVDYGNWLAAACLHEAHGELVDAVECRLQVHHQRQIGRRQRQRTSSALSSLASSLASSPADMTRRRRHSSKASVESNVTEGSSGEDEDGADDGDDAFDEEDDSGDSDRQLLREELLELVMKLVVAPTGACSESTRAAILARLLVKWFDYGLGHTELEVFLIDAKVFKHVAAPLAELFFGEIVANVSLHAQTPTTFDERDRIWVRRCHRLPFSGQFLFHVCVWFLEQTPATATTRPGTSRLVDVVRANIEQNDLRRDVVRLGPHSAQVLGKSDPLETHVKVFTCGHVFPKRVFEEELLPEFEKRMHALPTPLFTTKHVLLTEFKRSHVEAPCPVCAFNRISQLVFEAAAATSHHQQQRELSQSPPPKAPAVYFLHRRSVVAPNLSASARWPNGASNHRRQRPRLFFICRTAAAQARALGVEKPERQWG